MAEQLHTKALYYKCDLSFYKALLNIVLQLEFLLLILSTLFKV